MSNAKDVTDASFEADVLKSDKPVLVDFWAEWCTPCRMVGPIIDDIASEYSDKISVAKVDVDSNPAVASTYGITSIPAVFVFKDGEVVARSIGAKPKAAFEQEFAEFLK